jgi:lysophospholipase L1-like esterase
MVAFGAVYDDDAAAEANEQIEPIGDVVIDWDAATAADPALTEDGAHPTPEGQVRLAELIRDAVEECA